MKTLAVAAAVIAVAITGCAPVDMDQIMGRTEGTPIPASQRIDGHSLTPENRYTNGTGHTRCKPCVLGRKSA